MQGMVLTRSYVIGNSAKPILASNPQESNNKMLTIKRTACLTHADDQEDHAGLVGIGTDEREHHEHGPRRVDWVSACRKTHMESMMNSKMKYGPFGFGFELFPFSERITGVILKTVFYIYTLEVPAIKLGLV
jgi:hypothetical protein